MKRLILICVLLVLFAGVSIGAEEDQKYRVEVSIVFNAIPADEMNELVKELSEKYGKDSCSFNVSVKKAETNSTYFYLADPDITVDE